MFKYMPHMVRDKKSKSIEELLGFGLFACVSKHEFFSRLSNLAEAQAEVYARVSSDLEVALVGVEDDRLPSVVDPLHLQGKPADGRLEVRLLCIHHQPNTVLLRMLGCRGDSLCVCVS